MEHSVYLYTMISPSLVDHNLFLYSTFFEILTWEKLHFCILVSKIVEHRQNILEIVVCFISTQYQVITYFRYNRKFHNISVGLMMPHFTRLPNRQNFPFLVFRISKYLSKRCNESVLLN